MRPLAVAVASGAIVPVGRVNFVGYILMTVLTNGVYPVVGEGNHLLPVLGSYSLARDKHT